MATQIEETTINRFKVIVGEDIDKGIDFRNYLPDGGSVTSLNGWAADSSIDIQLEAFTATRAQARFTPNRAGTFELTATVRLSTGETRKGKIIFEVSDA